MAEKINFRTLWHEAGITALVLAATSSAYLVAGGWLENASFTGSGVILFILDLAKIVLCFFILRRCLHAFAAKYEDSSRTDVRRLGALVAVLSAFIFAGVSMVYYQLNMDSVTASIDEVMKTMPKLDRNSLDALELVKGNLPKIMFFFYFIYCSLYGWVLSAILAIKAVPDNPFGEAKAADDDEDDDD